MNDVKLIGNLARDPEVKVVHIGDRTTSVLTTVIAVNERYQNKTTKEWSEQTVFIPIEAWDTGANRLAEKCAKGDRLLIEGKLKTDNWEKDGQKHSRLLVRVNKFSLLNKKRSENSNG